MVRSLDQKHVSRNLLILAVLCVASFWGGRELGWREAASGRADSKVGASPNNLAKENAHEDLQRAVNQARDAYLSAKKSSSASTLVPKATTLAIEPSSTQAEVAKPAKQSTSEAKIDAPRSAAILLQEALAKTKDSIFIQPTTQGHEAVLAEKIDPEWSPAANQQLMDYLSAQLGERIEVPVIDCRENICELLAAGKLGGSVNDDSMDFQRMLADMHSQQWWSALGFDQQGTQFMVTFSPDGRPLFFVYLTRK